MSSPAGEILDALVAEAKPGEKVGVHVCGHEVTIVVELPKVEDGWTPGWTGKTTLEELLNGRESFGDLLGPARYALETARSEDE